MTLLDFFDIQNKEHLGAWLVLTKTGMWPETFYNTHLSELEFNDGWQNLLAWKMAEHYVTVYINES